MSKPYWTTIDPISNLTDIPRIGLQSKLPWLIRHDIEVEKEQHRLKRNKVLTPLVSGAFISVVIYLGAVYLRIAIEYFKA